MLKLRTCSSMEELNLRSQTWCCAPRATGSEGDDWDYGDARLHGPRDLAFTDASAAIVHKTYGRRSRWLSNPAMARIMRRCWHADPTKRPDRRRW
ncbi:hypothetical protein GUJ93_ZPchr0191g16383 [Zizania palustris]|uniref:Serine-threonine/tyrosine-protein kinase catalytic domain-containing protein n=1 Tax=Zizania palustris TaxID=103762 RepID=A0A8J5TEC8_ZIZPA|nr:hypothetical protein GUJ93_ZPchr0191g16383 [Zizania palustris]